MKLLARVATVSGWTLVSRVLGLVRDRLLAGAFGGSLALDAFFLAFSLPNLLRNLFGEGALAAAFVPRYVQLRESDQGRGEAFAGAVLARLAVGLTLLCGWLMAVLVIISHLGGPEAWLVTWLAVPQAPYLILICLSAIIAGVLHGRRHFAVPAIAPVILNCVLIGCVLLSASIAALPYAVLLAGVFQLGFHVWGLWRSGSLPTPRWSPSHDLKELRRSVLPVLLAASVYQLNVVIDSVLAFVLVPGAGAVAYLYFGNRLLQFPMALVGHGVGTAIYPELASAATQGWAKTGSALREGTAILAGLLFPAAVGLWLVADPLVRTVYQSGAFGEAAVERTVLVTQMLALALVPIALAKLFMRACHAHRDQRSPLIIGLIAVAVNLVANVILVQTALQEAGLALGTAISGAVSCTIYAALLIRRGTGRPLALAAIMIPLVGSLSMAVVLWGVLTVWPHGDGFVSHLVRLLVSVGLGAGVYLAIAGPILRRRLRRSRRSDVAEPGDP